MNVMLEYIIVFVGVLVINIFVSKFNRNNLGDALSPELIYLKKIYKISINKINRDKVSNVVIVTNTFIISTIYIILMYLLTNWILRGVIGLILLILLIIICYGLIGRYYRKRDE